MSALGAFTGSALGAFVESSLNARASAAGPAGELFVTYRTKYTYDSNPYTGPFPDPQAPLNVTRQVFEIQRMNADTGANPTVIFTREATAFPARVTVNPPTTYDPIISIHGFERIDDSLYVLVEEKITVHESDSNQDTYETSLVKMSLSGSVQSTLVFATGYTLSSSEVVPVSLCSGTQQDGDEEAVETKLYLFERAKNALANVGSTLVVVNPGTLSEETPIAGLGATYTTNYTTTRRIGAYHNDSVQGAGVRYIYDSTFSAKTHAVQGSVSHNEWASAVNVNDFRISRVTASPPRVHTRSGSRPRIYNIDTGSLVNTAPNASLNDAGTSDTYAVRDVSSTSVEFYYWTTTTQVRRKTITYPTGTPTIHYTQTITPTATYDDLSSGAADRYLPSEVPDEV